MTDPILDALDPEQLQVAKGLDAPMVVLAGAGTGKTRAITHRVAHAVRLGRYEAGATLAVTFTTRAAGEMRSRLAALGVRGVQARTIHSAALRQCQYFWPRVYRAEFPPVADNTFPLAARAATKVLGSHDQALVRDLASEISWAKSSNVSPDRYPLLAGRAHREVNGATPAQVSAVMRSYEELKAASGQVDFDDILLCASALLVDDEEAARAIRGQYRHFVVDEYQDVSALQHRLIGLWVDGREDVCIVGDPNQAIHAFAGARPEYLLGFAREHEGAELVRLVRNYRSSPEILGVGNKVLGDGPERAGRLRAMRASGEPPSFHAVGSEADEAEAVAGWFVALHAEGVTWSEMAVLYRINAQAPVLEAAMTTARVPYTVRGTEAYFERAEVRQAVQALLHAAAVDAEADPLQLLGAYLGHVGWTVQPPSGMGRQRERWESLNALSDMVGEESAERPSWRAEDFAEWLAERAAMQAAPVADSVTLSTMHAAKGLEWDAVAIVGAREGLVPFVLSQSGAELAEERRLLYVAVTRARSRLRISHATSGARGRGGRSRFLAGIAPEQLVERPVKARGTRQCPVCGQALITAPDRKLRRHMTCEVAYDEALFEALRSWRREEAEAASVPAFVIFTDSTLRALAEAEPTDARDLLRVPGIGAAKVERWGQACLAIVAKHVANR